MATRLLHVVPACIGAQLLCNNPTLVPGFLILHISNKSSLFRKQSNPGICDGPYKQGYFFIIITTPREFELP